MPPETTSVPRSSAGEERRPPVSIVIPVFNESAALGRLNVRLGRVRQDLDRSAEVIYVDDGSTDRSLEELRVIQARDSGVTVVALARNAGQHAAVLAGFAHARGEVVITLDADLQNPPEEIPRLLAEIDAGYDVVGTRREGRSDASSWSAASSSGRRARDCSRCLRSCSSSSAFSSSRSDSSANTWGASTSRCVAGPLISFAPSTATMRRSRAARRDGVPGHRV